MALVEGDTIDPEAREHEERVRLVAVECGVGEPHIRVALFVDLPDEPEQRVGDEEIALVVEGDVVGEAGGVERGELRHDSPGADAPDERRGRHRRERAAGDVQPAVIIEFQARGEHPGRHRQRGEHAHLPAGRDLADRRPHRGIEITERIDGDRLGQLALGGIQRTHDADARLRAGWRQEASEHTQRTQSDANSPQHMRIVCLAHSSPPGFSV